jgi:hypothetical protein
LFSVKTFNIIYYVFRTDWGWNSIALLNLLDLCKPLIHPELDLECIVYGPARQTSIAWGKSSSSNDYDYHNNGMEYWHESCIHSGMTYFLICQNPIYWVLICVIQMLYWVNPYDSTHFIVLPIIIWLQLFESALIIPYYSVKLILTF